MKFIRNLCLAFFCFGFITAAISQNEGYIYDGGLTIKTTSDFFKIQASDVKNTKAFLKDNDIAGTPYLNNDFVPGNIITKNAVKYIDIPLRYNIYNDEIEFSQDGEAFALENPLNYSSISIAEQSFIYSSFVGRAKGEAGKASFFELMNNKGKLFLLKRYSVQFIKPSPSQGYVEAKLAEFKKTPDSYYFKFGSSPAQEVGNLKSTLLMFGKHSKRIATFIKAEKLKLRNQEDLLRIVSFYNDLL